MAKDTRHPPDALLCEDCGYPLSGLDTSGNCPECGRSIESSLPEFRTGSAYFEHRSIKNWLRYAVRALRASAVDRARIRIDHEFARGLLGLNVFAAGAIPTVAVLVIAGLEVIVHIAMSPPGSTSATDGLLVFLGAAAIAIILPTIIAMFLLVLTLFEQQGIMLFGARQGWRITDDVALCVCAHASVAWVIASGLATAGGLGGFGLIAVSPSSTITMTIARPFVLLLSGFLIGMLWFEILVFLGVRSCKFANHPDAH